MKCLKCESEQPEDARFCNKCGNKFQPLGPASDGQFEQSKTHATLAPERKHVTVLFSDITGYTSIAEKLDPEQVKQITGSIFAGVKEIVARYDGFIERVMGDGVVVFFGVPHVREDDSVRAVHTAMEIHDLVKGISPKYENWVGSPLSMHTGINTGLVVTADVDTERGTHGIAGDAVNVAARLSGLAAPGEILIGEETLRRTRERFNFHDMGLKQVKGKAEPIPVFKIIAPKPSKPSISTDRQISSEMVGRDAELARLELQVMKLANGEGSVVNVFGEAGIGKSRLIVELRKREVMKRVTLLEGRAMSMGKNLSFHPVIDLMKQWAGIGEGDSESAGFDKLERTVRAVHPDEANEILPFLGTLMGMKLKGKYAETMKGIEGEALEKLIIKNVRELLVKGSQLRPMVMVLEDLHWADESSLGLLESLYRLAEKNRLLFINVFRPGYWRGETKRVVEKVGEVLDDRYVEIALQPLDKQMSDALIGNMLDLKGLPHSLRAQIGERTGGNPFFIEEIVRSLVDQGAIVRRNGSFDVTEKIHSVVVPHTINDVLMARIDRLEERTRELVKCASVIGRSFFDRILKDVATSIENIDSRLSYLKDLQLIRDRIRLEELEYLFKHALTQEAAYESTLLQQRKELHRRVAESIEKLFEKRLHEFYGTLAWHYSKADDPGKAEDWMVKAGEEALRTSASSEALHYYKEALRLYLEKYGDAADQAKLAQFEKNIAVAHYNKCQYEDAVEYIDKVFIRMGKRSPKRKITRAIKLLYDKYIIILRIYLPWLGRKRTPDDSVNSYFDLTVKKSNALVHVDPQRGFVEHIGEMRESFRYDLSKLEAAGEIHGTVQQCAAWIRYVSGNWDEVQGPDRDLIDAGIKSGIYWVVGTWIFTLAAARICQGRFGEAKESIENLARLGDLYDFDLFRIYAYLYSTELLLASGKYYLARSEAERLASHCAGKGLENHELHAFGYKASAEVSIGEIKAAEDSLAHARQIMGGQSFWPPWYVTPYLLAQFKFDVYLLRDAVHSKDGSAVQKLAKQALKSGKEAVGISAKYAAIRTESYRLMGVYYWLTGKQGKALKWFDKSIKEGERLGARPDLARAYMEIGKRLMEPGSKYKELNGLSAGEYLKKARAIFEEMDLQWDLEELEKFQSGT
ncbi:MAG: adenylate/guanylate cyclase domain-containing protein [Syntrophobacteraceae bacterium]|jgi:class 3 adenylate cyclase/tetratricopeptide (TPR) repeat protein